MANDKHQSHKHYMLEELADAQQNTAYGEGDGMPAEQYNSPESMHKRKNTHKGGKSITQGYKG